MANFGKALEHVKKGGKVRCSKWGISEHLEMTRGLYNLNKNTRKSDVVQVDLKLKNIDGVPADLFEINEYDHGTYNHYPFLTKVEGSIKVPWVPSNKAILSENWILLENERDCVDLGKKSFDDCAVTCNQATEKGR